MAELTENRNCGSVRVNHEQAQTFKSYAFEILVGSSGGNVVLRVLEPESCL